MINYLKILLSHNKFLYNLIKKLKNRLNYSKIFYYIEGDKIEYFSLNQKFFYFNNNKVLNYLNKNPNSYIFLTDKKIKKEERKKIFFNLLQKLIKNEQMVIYDGDCPFNSQIISCGLLKKYLEMFNHSDFDILYPYRFFYFYKKYQFKIANIGANHFIYNFNATFNLPNGGRTIGDGGPVDWRLKFIPDLTNKSFLDIGTEEGYAALYACTKNAKFVRGINIQETTEYDFFPDYFRPKNVTSRTREDIEITQKYLKQIFKIDDKQLVYSYQNIYNLGDEKFDIVFCFGVLYHLKNPYLALENLYKITKDTLYLETQGSYSFNNNHYAALLDENESFVHHSPKSLKFLLEKAGFREVEILHSGVNKVNVIGNIVLKALK